MLIGKSKGQKYMMETSTACVVCSHTDFNT